ncbi:hypothetical protein, partial [Ruminococcus callidus]|uniref:hypothetical protein n=1 Tax=Ruminococcus callidus TaxID=40519 RepID=UPI003C6E952C
HNSIYVHAINEETKESVIVEKATLEVVKSPGAGRQSGTQKIKTITQLNYRAKMGDKSSEIETGRHQRSSRPFQERRSGICCQMY